MSRARITLEQATNEGWYRPNENQGLCMCGCGATTKIASETDKKAGTLNGFPRRFLSGHAAQYYSQQREQSDVRECSECKATKPQEDFPMVTANRLKNQRYRRGMCRVCWGIDQTNWRLQKMYGITYDQYLALLESQGGGCAICEKKVDRKNKRLAVDHDHETGLVRGILCENCNRAIGLLNNDDDLFWRGFIYLQKALDANIETGLYAHLGW